MRSTRLIRSFARYVLVVFLVVLVPHKGVQAQDKIIRVCVSDARNEAGLADVTVQLSADQLVLTGTTAGNGCVYLEGAFPVAVTSEIPVFAGLQAGAPYPNPAGQRVQIPVFTAEPASDVHIEVFDVQGRRLAVPHTPRYLQNGVAFDLSVRDVADGVYFYRVTGKGGAATGKFIRRAGVPSPARAVYLEDAVSASNPAGGDHLIAMADSVTIAVQRDGFETRVEQRVVRNFETVPFTLFKVTDDLVPLIDMFGVKYLGRYPGGLYPDQQNEMPAQHLAAGLARANTIAPLDLDGNPDPNGRIVMTSIGMSTTSSIFCGVADPGDSCKLGTFMDVVQQDAAVNDQLVLVDGADPGKTADKWQASDDKTFDRVRDEELTPFGLSEAQVQVAWVNLASSIPTTTLPDAGADALNLKQQYGNALRAFHTRYPNLKLVFFASRVYAGYATSEINPEPFAYESGFAVKWTIEAQIRQMYEEGSPVDAGAGNLDFNNRAPWIAWGPYLWADGANARSDGLVWLPEDLKDDGTHLNRPGIEKVTAILLDFFKTSSLTRCWFLENGGACE